jgi:hypothetical protein
MAANSPINMKGGGEFVVQLGLLPLGSNDRVR